MANLIRNRPFQPMQSLQREIDRLFGDFMPSFGGEEMESGIWAPNMDMTEQDSEYIFTMDLPGVSKDDININVEKHRLTISGERKEEKREESENRLVVERRSGSFFRSFPLPEAAGDEDVRAEMKDGVLTIHVRKSEDSKPKRVQIQ